MLTSTDFQRLQSKCTPLHLPKFQTLKDKYETTDVQIKILKFQVDIFKEKKNLQHNIIKIEEEMKLLKKKNDELEQEIIEIDKLPAVVPPPPDVVPPAVVAPGASVATAGAAVVVAEHIYE